VSVRLGTGQLSQHLATDGPAREHVIRPAYRHGLSSTNQVRSFSVEPIPSPHVCGDMDRNRRRQRRYLDVQRGGRMAMTNLTTHPLMVSLVQVATSLGMFLFALPAARWRTSWTNDAS